MASRLLLFKKQRNTFHSANPHVGKQGNVQVTQHYHRDTDLLLQSKSVKGIRHFTLTEASSHCQGREMLKTDKLSSEGAAGEATSYIFSLPMTSFCNYVHVGALS